MAFGDDISGCYLNLIQNVFKFFAQIFTFVGSRQNQNWDIDDKGEQMLTEILASLQTAQAFSEQKGEWVN
jgi:hypothetical protein